jgi:hypothetical protein
MGSVTHPFRYFIHKKWVGIIGVNPTSLTLLKQTNQFRLCELKQTKQPYRFVGVEAK